VQHLRDSRLNGKNFLRSLYCPMRLVSGLPVEADEFEIEVLDAVRMLACRTWF
jgi:hypothetical protein